MADTAKRLFGPLALPNSAATQYTVPALTTTAVRNIHVVTTDGASHQFTLSIGADAAGTRYYATQTVYPDVPFDWNGFLVLSAAEVLQAYADSATGCTMTVSGVEIT